MAKRVFPFPRMIPARIVIPNTITLLGFCAGLSSIRFAVENQWELAVGAILLATIFDFLDGYTARLMKGTSQFGAELDSLSDLVCFGVAPAILLHQWVLHRIEWGGWFFVLLFCCCSALRLARFNTQSKKRISPAWESRFFHGVPAPAGAALALAPMYLSFQFGLETVIPPMYTGLLMGIIALLMISTVPTFAIKKLSLRGYSLVMTVFLFTMAIILFVSFPWIMLTLGCGVYALTIPISTTLYYKVLFHQHG